MMIRSLALALALSFTLTTVAEAKKKPAYSAKAQKKRNKAITRKYKTTAHTVKPHKVSKVKVKHAS
jgi:hypothetical protein